MPESEVRDDLARTDVVSAQHAARLTGQPVEILDRRTEDSTTWANPNGSFTSELHAGPARVQDADGIWRDIDLSLAERTDGVEPRVSKADLRFSRGGTGEISRVGLGERWLSSRLEGHDLPAPSLDGPVATYREIAPGIDLVLEARRMGVKEHIVLKRRPTKPVSYRFPLRTRNVSVSLDADGRLIARKPSGAVFAVSDPPLMWGAETDPASLEPTKLAPVATELVGEGAKLALEVRPDFGFLSDPAVKLPITIDPTTSVSLHKDTFVHKAYPTTSFYNDTDLRVGTYDGGSAVGRSLLRFDFAELKAISTGVQVSSATLKLWEWHSASCTAKKFNVFRLQDTFGAGATWNNQPPIASTVYGSATVAHGYSSSCPDAWVNVRIDDLVQYWLDGGTNYGLELKAASETDSLSWKRFNSGDASSKIPSLSVTYNAYPKDPTSPQTDGKTASTSSPGLYTNKTKPTMSAVVSDPDGGSLRARVCLWTSGGTSIDCPTTVGNGTSVASGSRSTYTPPTLSHGTTYKWRVRSSDGSLLSHGTLPSDTTFYWFTVDTSKPSTPAASSTQYPENDWAGGAGSGGTFTWSATDTVSGISGYYYGFDNPAPATWTTANSVSWTPATNGLHALYVQAKDRAGNLSPVKKYSFGVGNASLGAPVAGQRFQRRLVLSASGPTSITGARFQFRRTDGGTWIDMPVGQTGGAVTHPDGSPVTAWPVATTAGASPTLVWDAVATAAIAGQDGPIEVRAVLTDATNTSYTDPVRAKLDQEALGGDYASAGVGPGSVNLVTGNFAVGSSDVSISSYGSDLTVGRTFNSRDPLVPSAFGQGWAPSVAVAEAGADWSELHDAQAAGEGDFVVVYTADGAPIGFSVSGGTYVPEAGAEDLSLEKVSGEFRLSDLDGNVTVFAQSEAGSADYIVDRVIQPGSGNTTSYVYETVSGAKRIKRILAPVPAGVDCSASDPTGLQRGCRALDFVYATSTTASGSSLGDYQGRVSQILFTAWDPQASPAAMRTVAVATYLYDTTGHLREAWDPRITPALKTAYTYDAQGHLATLTPPGELAWSFAYAPTSADPDSGRLASVSRPAIPSGTATTTMVYGVALSGTGAPHDMSAASVAAWAQEDAPHPEAGGNPGTGATAIVPPNGDPSTLERASIHYFNRDGREVNLAAPGGYITTTEYDVHGNVVRELSASNRAAALAAGPSIEEQAGRAGELDTQRTYDADGLELLEELGPLHEVTLDSGNLVQAREHTVYTYDEGAPPGGPFHLVTTTKVGAGIEGEASDADVRVTKTDYDWSLRLPTVSTVDAVAGGLNLQSKTFYDPATGLVTETRMPAGPQGGTAHSTLTIYYRAGSYPEHPACGDRPEWANLVCKTLPAAQPGTAGLPDLPVTRLEYTILNHVASKTETVGADTRTTAHTHDAAGRVTSEQVTATAGEALSTVTYQYDSASGRQTRVSTTSGQIVREFDVLGRLVSYTDASGNVATTSYDLLGRPVITTDGKGSQTRSYDQGSERRGVLTGLSDSTGLQFSATYDPDGRQVTRGYPNGLVATTTYNATGSAMSLVYEQTQGCSTDCTWLSFNVSESIHGQWRGQMSQLSAQTYSYDAAGRIAKVEDSPATQGCTTRTYAYDANSNRTRQSSFGPAADLGCQVASGEIGTDRTYDAADRLTDAGYAYDAFGRTSTVPAADAGGNQITATYYANDLVRSLAQAGTTRTWSLDPARRLASWSDTAGLSKANRYATDSDSPAWIAENASATAWTRNVAGIDGDLVAIADEAGVVRLQLANLHGDVVAVTHPSASPPPGEEGLVSTFESTEFGAPRSGPGARYGWLGAKQRPADALSEGILLGARVYFPALGRFLQVDPVRGGGANAYDYAEQDPCAKFDLNGRAWWNPWSWGKCGRALNDLISFAKRLARWVEDHNDKVMRTGAGTFVSQSQYAQWIAFSGYYHNAYWACGKLALSWYKAQWTPGGLVDAIRR